eukprot:scaffold55148_cov49-Cyclotella_meneghiniana.AAC.14
MSDFAEVQVMEANDDWSPEEGRFLIHYHNFANLPQERGQSYLHSPKFNCLDREWYLSICPGGSNSSQEGMVAAYLYLGPGYTSDFITIDFDIILKNKTGDDFRFNSDPGILFPRKKNARGWPNYASRDEILDSSNNILNDDGTLTFEVRIRRH